MRRALNYSTERAAADLAMGVHPAVVAARLHGVKPPPKQGHKLTATDATAIRQDDRAVSEIADHYGINRRHVWLIRSGRRWKEAAR